jgi:hypothetical protein
MEDDPDDPTVEGGIPANRYDSPEAALGGADAVPKTTYVTGHGTEPEARSPERGPTAQVQPGSGLNATWIVLAFFLVAAVLVYLLGFGR